MTVSQPEGLTLGKRYRDVHTGMEGVATAKHIYLYGCVRISLEFLKDGRPETEVFDEQRLVPVDVEEVVQPQATSGGPRNDPGRPAVPRRSRPAEANPTQGANDVRNWKRSLLTQ